MESARGTELVWQRERRIDPVQLGQLDAIETEKVQALLRLGPKALGPSTPKRFGPDLVIPGLVATTRSSGWR